jgi:branched-chain amino acid transport system ATP-binding protein
MATTEALLQIRDLHVYYGPAHTLQGVDLTVGRHEAVSLIGRNGMGKTTLCQALMGLIPYRGSILFNGAELNGKKSHQIAAAGIGYVPQGRRVFPSLSVHEHLKLVEPKGNGARWTVDGIYELFPKLAERKRSGGAQLSGGEQQMLAIGRALLTNPRLLVMDEPSEGLAPVIIDHMVEVLRQLATEDTALLLVEQNLGVATGVAQHLAVMVTGRIALETTSDELLADEDAQRRYLGVSTHADALLET